MRNVETSDASPGNWWAQACTNSRMVRWRTLSPEGFKRVTDIRKGTPRGMAPGRIWLDLVDVPDSSRHAAKRLVAPEDEGNLGVDLEAVSQAVPRKLLHSGPTQPPERQERGVHKEDGVALRGLTHGLELVFGIHDVEITEVAGVPFDDQSLQPLGDVHVAGDPSGELGDSPLQERSHEGHSGNHVERVVAEDL